MPSYVIRHDDHAVFQTAKVRARAENVRLDDLILALVRAVAERPASQPLLPLTLSAPRLDRAPT